MKLKKIEKICKSAGTVHLYDHRIKAEMKDEERRVRGSRFGRALRVML